MSGTSLQQKTRKRNWTLFRLRGLLGQLTPGGMELNKEAYRHLQDAQNSVRKSIEALGGCMHKYSWDETEDYKCIKCKKIYKSINFIKKNKELIKND